MHKNINLESKRAKVNEYIFFKSYYFKAYLLSIFYIYYY